MTGWAKGNMLYKYFICLSLAEMTKFKLFSTTWIKNLSQQGCYTYKKPK